MFSDFDNTTFARFYDPLIGKRKYVLKKIVNGCVFILFLRMVFAAREPARAMNTRAFACGLVPFSAKKVIFPLYIFAEKNLEICLPVSAFSMLAKRFLKDISCTL